MKTDRERLEEKIFYSPDGCWYWTGTLATNQIGILTPRFLFKGRNSTAYRVSFELFKGGIPAGLFVCHHCDNRLCVNPDHLFIGTNRDNLDDMLRKGRSKKGERCGMSKLTDEQVIEIRSLQLSTRAIGRKYNIHQTTVCSILSRETWKHI